MGGSEDGKSISKSLEMENLSLDISASNRFSRDLLQRFRGSANEHGAAAAEEEEDADAKVELNLGLSMGGRFGVDKSSNKLVRSSSIASCLPESRDDNDAAAAAAAYPGLVRTSSLPVETEEEWRKRKELQTLRRMEAKRRRSEKQRNLKGEREGGGGSLSVEEKKEIEVNLRARLDREKSLCSLKRTGSGLASQSGLSKGKGSGGGFGSQGSVESKGGSSSTVSDLESKNLQGISSFFNIFYFKI